MTYEFCYENQFAFSNSGYTDLHSMQT